MRVWGIAVVLGVALALAGCGEAAECGPGTIRSGDRCVAADVAGECECGPGTHLAPSEGRCEPDELVTVCGINTTECVDDAGVAVCIGFDCPLPAGCE